MLIAVLVAVVALGAVLVTKQTPVIAGSLAPLPAAKATIFAREDQAIATARAQHPTKPTQYTPPPEEPTATFTAGIFQTHQGPFSNSDFGVVDMYRGPVGSVWKVVFAGTAWTNFPTAGVGALRVYTISGGPVGVFDAPDSSSYLEITDITGTTLQLQSNTSTSLTFNLATDPLCSCQPVLCGALTTVCWYIHCWQRCGVRGGPGYPRSTPLPAPRPSAPASR